MMFIVVGIHPGPFGGNIVMTRKTFDTYKDAKEYADTCSKDWKAQVFAPVYKDAENQLQIDN